MRVKVDLFSPFPGDIISSFIDSLISRQRLGKLENHRMFATIFNARLALTNDHTEVHSPTFPAPQSL